MAQVNDEFEAAPIRTRTRRVPPEWIDYNGHMNVAYYTMAFDNALDEVLASSWPCCSRTASARLSRSPNGEANSSMALLIVMPGSPRFASR